MGVAVMVSTNAADRRGWSGPGTALRRRRPECCSFFPATCLGEGLTRHQGGRAAAFAFPCVPALLGCCGGNDERSHRTSPACCSGPARAAGPLIGRCTTGSGANRQQLTGSPAPGPPGAAPATGTASPPGSRPQGQCPQQSAPLRRQYIKHCIQKALYRLVRGRRLLSMRSQHLA